MWNPIKTLRHRQKTKKMIRELMRQYKEEITFSEGDVVKSNVDHFKDIWCPPKDEFRIVDGVKYRVIRYRCTCSCHTTGAIHIASCCNGGFIESLEKVEDL